MSASISASRVVYFAQSNLARLVRPSVPPDDPSSLKCFWEEGSFRRGGGVIGNKPKQPHTLCSCIITLCSRTQAVTYRKLRERVLFAAASALAHEPAMGAAEPVLFVDTFIVPQRVPYFGPRIASVL